MYFRGLSICRFCRLYLCILEAWIFLDFVAFTYDFQLIFFFQISTRTLLERITEAVHLGIPWTWPNHRLCSSLQFQGVWPQAIGRVSHCGHLSKSCWIPDIEVLCWGIRDASGWSSFGLWWQQLSGWLWRVSGTFVGIQRLVCYPKCGYTWFKFLV